MNIRIKILAITLMVIFSGLTVFPAQAQDYDLVILNGRVMDPESGLDAVRNVGIKDGRILEITETKIEGKETINAEGHVVAPGFIDLHIHGQDPYAIKLQLRDGVTSPLEIEAGAWPVDDYYKERDGKSQANYGVSVGHVWARVAAMDNVNPKGLGLYADAINAAAHDGAKWGKDRSTPEQLKKIMANIEQGLRQGGIGIGFPVGYYTAVGSSEIMKVAGLAKRYDSFITTHVRYLSNIPPSGYLGFEELLAVATTNQVPLIVHHLPSNCLQNTPECLDLVDEARSSGLNVVAEFYPYTAGSSIIGADYLSPGFQERTGMDYKDITYVKTGEKMTKELLAKYRKEDPGGPMIMHHIKEPDMMAAFAREGVFVGADGMPFVDDKGGIPAWDAPYGVGKGHPRGAGTHAKVLRLVREQSVVPLMEAIAKLSYLQANFLEDMVPDMKHRGRLKPGAIADITIFDPAMVTDNSGWDKGKNSLPSTGIPYVIVNGTVVVKDSKVLKDVFPGKPIRNLADSLPSWNDGSAKTAILEFVAAVTDENGKDYVKPAERIAVFDNDGTLWVEQPIYTQVTFIFDRMKELAPQHSEWKTTQPFKALLEGDMKTVAASGEKGILEMVMATHTGMTAEQFTDIVWNWIGTSKHPRFKRPYTELVYQPQLELMAYLRENGFKTFIVSGGGIEFMRPWAEKVYGIPPEQVVGSSVKTEFQIKDGKPVLVRIPTLNFIDDKAGKPVGIYEHIGRRPILAFGNSDSDMQMIQYTKAGDGLRLGLFVHHTDAEREYAYDRKSHMGTLDKVLDMAEANDWIIVDMKKDWKTVFTDR